MAGAADALPRIVGRYAIYAEIASGGMASVHYGRLLGPAGFSRTVAIKRLFPQFARDPEFVTMFLDEARLAARVRHPNVVDTLDVVTAEGELFLVMAYVQGESLGRLVRAASSANTHVPPPIVSAILAGALHGLHAAHEATDENGAPLGIVHRDVSPQNILIGADGVPRVLDFGVAKAAGRLHTTREGRVKGKLAYMAPEQLSGGEMTRQADLFGAGVVLWQTLTGRRLFEGDTEAIVLAKLLQEPIAPPSRFAPHISAALDEVTLRGLARDPKHRFATAKEMALALEAAERPATTSEVSAWVMSVAAQTLASRSQAIAEIERSSAPRTLSEITGSVGEPATGESPSNVSSISVSTTPPRRKRSLLVALLIASVVAIVVVTAFLPTLRGTPTESSAAGALPEVSRSATVIPSAAPVASAPEAPSLAPTPPASASVVAAPPAPRAPNRASGKKPGARSPSNADCYYVDADGIRHIRASCR